VSRVLLVANWKMNMTRVEARAYAGDLGSRIGDSSGRAELVLAPPYTALDAARDQRGRWALAAQNLSDQRAGAFTGEVSAAMIAEAGCRYVIVGHSERRTLFGEDGPLLSRKLARARESGLIPIYCVGETQAQRAAGSTAATLARQAEALAGDPEAAPLVVAYEPVWAIGTGLAATPADSAAAASGLRAILASRHDLRVLYGGSVNPGNARDLLGNGGIDGFLVGGASLQAATFAALAEAASA
jgi:triosephosphate isomerase